ncbi:hypothetical protein RFI_05071 [Reticulomyxa filosa]|uniref:Uncharacterized protein n=1 Tax=Reticulomyxa filosa TaxID=46433 RepID=X6P0G0_RETFI|nr:hypothetical protein RFI_05071 [Reticulomyxa filosa]|eukprot:ETO32045.1 hypothetical protein RFI_05071 [Reticulomyxa filosa]
MVIFRTVIVTSLNILCEKGIVKYFDTALLILSNNNNLNAKNLLIRIFSSYSHAKIGIVIPEKFLRRNDNWNKGVIMDACGSSFLKPVADNKMEHWAMPMKLVPPKDSIHEHNLCNGGLGQVPTDLINLNGNELLDSTSCAKPLSVTSSVGISSPSIGNFIQPATLPLPPYVPTTDIFGPYFNPLWSVCPPGINENEDWHVCECMGSVGGNSGWHHGIFSHHGQDDMLCGSADQFLPLPPIQSSSIAHQELSNHFNSISWDLNTFNNPVTDVLSLPFIQRPFVNPLTETGLDPAMLAPKKPRTFNAVETREWTTKKKRESGVGHNSKEGNTNMIQSKKKKMDNNTKL